MLAYSYYWETVGIFWYPSKARDDIPGDSLGANEGSAWICTYSRINETVPGGTLEGKYSER